MTAKLKCSHCGAEMTNLTFSWGKKQWLWMIVAFLPLIGLVWWLERPRGDFMQELKTSIMETLVTTNGIAVLGKVTNSGKHEWQSVQVEAEFYGNDGRFLDEESQFVSGSLRPGAEENFRLTLRSPGEELITNSFKVRLKVTDASNYAF